MVMTSSGLSPLPAPAPAFADVVAATTASPLSSAWASVLPDARPAAAAARGTSLKTEHKFHFYDPQQLSGLFPRNRRHAATWPGGHGWAAPALRLQNFTHSVRLLDILPRIRGDHATWPFVAPHEQGKPAGAAVPAAGDRRGCARTTARSPRLVTSLFGGTARRQRFMEFLFQIAPQTISIAPQHDLWSTTLRRRPRRDTTFRARRPAKQPSSRSLPRSRSKRHRPAVRAHPQGS